MGRWFPGFRPASADQVQAYRDAQYDLFRNARYEQAAGIRDETQRYLDLNDRACETARPLSRTQQVWHWHRALGAEDRDMSRLQRSAGRQGRQRRRTGRSR